MTDHENETYVLVYRNMNVYGGIQSIVIRVAQFLRSNNSKVFLFGASGELATQYFSPDETLLFESPGSLQTSAQIIASAAQGNITIISHDPLSAAHGYLLTEKVRKITRGQNCTIKFGVGVFHPRDFFREEEKKHVHFLNYVLVRAIGSKSLFFMNHACLKSHERALRKRFSDNLISPVPLDSRSATWAPRDSDSIRICSVGRIVSFKAYNFSIPETLCQVKQVGIDASWDVFGHGKDEELLRKIISEHPEVKIRFHGSISLEKFDEVVVEYDAFVGMGTAAVQAAQLGVPTIIAIDQERHRTYGFIYDLPFGNVGELEEKEPEYLLKDMIMAVAVSNISEKLEISKKCSKAVENYRVEDFVCRFKELSNYQSRPALWRILFCDLYNFTTKDSVVRRFYRLLRKIVV